MTSPNMGLTEPTPGIGGTPGPEWASILNSDLEIIDAHSHAPGSGVPINSAAIAINADLPFNDFSAISLLSAQFTSQTVNPSMTSGVFVKDGELTYIDDLGQVVQITINGSVNAATGSISGLAPYNDGVARTPSAVFSGVSKSFTWSYDSSRTARMASADLLVYPYDATSIFANSVTIKSPTALAASYSLTLPLAVATQANVISMSTGGVLSAGLAAGAVGAPSLAFAADLTKGFYSSAANEISYTTSGSIRASIDVNGIRVVPGAVTTPAFTFLANSNTGFYNSAANVISVSCNGAEISQFSGQGIRVANGSVSLPAIAFLDDTDTGFYKAAGNVNVIEVACNGVNVAEFSSQGLRSDSGSVSLPAFAFLGDTDTGMYRSAVNTLDFSTGGTNRLTISSAGINSEGGGAFKVKLFSGTIGASATNTLTAPSGSVQGVFGYTTFNGSSTWGPILDEGTTSSTAGKIGFVADGLSGGTSTTALLQNFDTNSTNSYRVIMFYQ